MKHLAPWLGISIVAISIFACSPAKTPSVAPLLADAVNTNTENSTSPGAESPLSDGQAQPGQIHAEIAPLLRAEDYDQTVNQAGAALSASPSDDTLKRKLADAYIARAWYYKSKRLNTYTLSDLFKAVETAPDYYRAHYEIGRFHNNQWQFSIGILDLNRALALKPDYAPAYTERAYSYYKNQRFEQALDDADRAIEMDPTDPRPYCTRSLIHAAIGKPDLALEDADKAVRISPLDASSYYNRSLIYTGRGQKDMAIADLETALKLSNDDMLTTRALADLRALQK
jgi:tetratricopeptide (TPR) repeat protein